MTKILAAASGTVIASKNDPNGYGEFIIIDHGDGYTTTYAHLKTRLKEAGDDVEKGKVIGIMGTTGNSTGPHLHFALKKGESIELKCGTSKVKSTIEEIREVINSETGEVMKRSSDGLNENEAGLIQFKADPLVVEKFIDIPELGRFVLTRNGKNIGIGVVLDAQ